MDIFFHILIGMILVGLGFFMVWKTRLIVDFFGSIDWADRHLGGGGTSLMYKFIGIILILTGFLWATNLWNAFLESTLGSLFPKPQVVQQDQTSE